MYCFLASIRDAQNRSRGFPSLSRFPADITGAANGRAPLDGIAWNGNRAECARSAVKAYCTQRRKSRYETNTC